MPGKLSTKRILALIITTLIFGGLMLANLTQNPKAYKIHDADVCIIQNVKMLSRAYWLSGGKGGSAPRGIEFESENRKKFRIEGLNFKAVENLKTLYDTLQYSSLEMTILTDRLGCDAYHRQSKGDWISVTGLSVGNRNFIRSSISEEEARADLKQEFRLLCFGYILLVIFILILKPKAKI